MKKIILMILLSMKINVSQSFFYVFVYDDKVAMVSGSAIAASSSVVTYHLLKYAKNFTGFSKLALYSAIAINGLWGTVTGSQMAFFAGKNLLG